jgi:hypothetical protein
LKKEDFKKLIKDVVDEMFNEVNVSGDIGGFDGPLTGKPLKKKIKFFDDDKK